MLNSPIEEVKSRLDIVEVIGSYIRLQKTGANFRALCPFHSEKKPSFFVSPARQIWHCFGCNAGGDIFKFVMQIEGLEFGDALRILAQRAGIKLKRQTLEDKQWQTKRQRLYEICELATRFFEKQLQASSTGNEVKKYLLSRGINEESLKKWRLGYAPDAWQGLSDFLTSKGYQKNEIENAGLALTSEQGSFYDRFRGRIIFPIFDFNSQVIGFAGRVFGQKEKTELAKYINTPNTLIYDKSQVLYGLHLAKMAMRKSNECILVEGYIDAILVSQAGNENVVATSGTALTPYQLKILKRYSENLLTAFDMDIAGDAATKRSIDLAQSLGFNIRILLLPEDSDPADLIAKNPREWQRVLQNSKSILEFYFETTFTKNDSKTPEGKKAIAKILLPVIKRIPNQIEKSFWIRELAKKLEVKEEDVAEELKKIKLSEEIFGLEPEETLNLPQKSRQELLEERLIILILKSPEQANLITKEDLSFFSQKNSQLISLLQKGGKPENEELTNLLNYFLLKSEIEPEEANLQEEFKNCLKEIRFLGIKNKLDEISRRIRKAEEEKNLAETAKLLREFNFYTKTLQDLETTA